jgi:Pentapeptide repeats (9 copies)
MAKSKKSNKWLALAEEMGFTEDKNTYNYPVKALIAQFQKDELLKKIGGEEGIKEYIQHRYYKKYNAIYGLVPTLLGQFFTAEIFAWKFKAMEINPKDPIARFSTAYDKVNKAALYPILENKLLNRQTTHPAVFEECFNHFANMIYYPSYHYHFEEKYKFICYKPALMKVLMQVKEENYLNLGNYIDDTIYAYERYNKEWRYFYEAIKIDGLHPQTIEEIDGFVQGYSSATFHHPMRTDEKDLDFLDYKQSSAIFFHYTLNPTNIDIGRTNIFRYFTNSDEAAVALFYELLEKYKNRAPDTVSDMIRSKLVNAYNSGERHFEGQEWDFEQSNLDNVDLSGCTFQSCWFGCSMKNANLEGTKFLTCNLKNTDMTGANLKNSTIQDCSVEGLCLFETNHEGILFYDNGCYAGMDTLYHFTRRE